MIKTIVAVLAVVALCIPSALSYAQQADTTAPQMNHMQVTDLSVATAFISWTTDQRTTGNKIEITSADSSWQVADSYPAESYAHYVLVTGLVPSTQYSFKIISADTQWDNDGEGYSFSTLGYIPSAGNSIALFGTLLDSWGNPLNHGLVRYWLYNEQDGASMPKTVLTNSEGDWNGNIGIMFNSTGTGPYYQNGEDLLFVEYRPNYWTSVRDSIDLNELVLSSPSARLLVLATSSIQVIDPGATEPGDVDGNGSIDIFDVLEILRIIGGRVTPDPAMSAAADVDANGRIDIFDLLALLKILRSTEMTNS